VSVADVVWIPDPVIASGLADLAGFAVVEDDRFCDIASQVRAIISRRTPITAEMMDAAPNLQVIAAHGVGTDYIDVEAATHRGIWVTNTPGMNADSVAELALAYIVLALRHVPRSARDALPGRVPMGKTLAESTVALLGAGSIGQRLARSLRLLGCRNVVFAYPEETDTPRVHRLRRTSAILGAGVLPLRHACASCDVLSVHLPLTPQTKGLIDASVLRAMKPGAAVVNTARGGVLDEDALADALETGSISEAVLDCTVVEPLPPEHRLRRLSGVLVTPHIAAQTSASLREVMGSCAKAVVAVCRYGETPLHPVNTLPPIST
jgi:phosphoglycerate dehydrogenase-like enzyme